MRTVSSSYSELKKDISVGRPGSVTRQYFDAFRRKRIPNASILVQEYKRVAFACANLNATGVAKTPLRLYLKTENNQQKSVLRKGIDLKPIPAEKMDYLSSKGFLRKTLRSFVNIEEVINHPALDLLEKANDSPYLNGQRLTELTQLYQEITGIAYWLIESDELFGIPTNIWILPSQYVTPVKQSKGKEPVDFYRYVPPGTEKPDEFSPDKVISYLMPSLINPYLDGLSPLEAAFEANEVSNKLLTHEDSFLENEGRPDAILSPDKESAIGAEEARRLEREYRLKFGRGRAGGVWAIEEAMNLTPLNFNPRDLARLEIHKWSKNDLANAFQVPFALVADSSHNRQQLEAAETQHAKHAIEPRLDRDAAIKNDLFLSRFDESGRLFFAYDDPVPENREEKLKENSVLTMNGIRTPNEARRNYGDPPMEGGDELRPINVSPELVRQESRDSGEAER